MGSFSNRCRKWSVPWTLSILSICTGFQAPMALMKDPKSLPEFNQLPNSKGHSFTSLMGSSSSSESNDTKSHTITLHYASRSCKIEARSDESILSALERNQRTLIHSLDLPNAMIPHDCRRGNCLTCCATLNSAESVLSSSDGLSPHISEKLSEQGYVLTCSSKVLGSGLELTLGENENVWKAMYQDRFETEPSQESKWAAMAQAKRRSDERNQFKWKQENERLLDEL